MVTNLRNGALFWVREEVLEDSVTLTLNRTMGDDDHRQDICAYSRHLGLGHKISGRLI